jgi:hypothetical protein
MAMNDVGKWLRDADPLAPGGADVELAGDQAQAMRGAMMAELGERRAPAAFWPQPLAVAGTIALTLASGVVVGRHLPERHDPSHDAIARTGAPGELRQLQFAMPGGTRVIWVFNSEFQP